MEKGPDMEKIAEQNTQNGTETVPNQNSMISRRAALRVIGGATAAVSTGVALTKPEVVGAQGPDFTPTFTPEQVRVKATATARAQATQTALVPTPTHRGAGAPAPRPPETPPQVPPGQENKGGWIAPTVIATAAGTAAAIFGISRFRRPHAGNATPSAETYQNAVNVEQRQPAIPASLPGSAASSTQETQSQPRVRRVRKSDYVKQSDGTYVRKTPDNGGGASTP